MFTEKKVAGKRLLLQTSVNNSQFVNPTYLAPNPIIAYSHVSIKRIPSWDQVECNSKMNQQTELHNFHTNRRTVHIFCSLPQIKIKEERNMQISRFLLRKAPQSITVVLTQMETKQATERVTRETKNLFTRSILQNCFSFLLHTRKKGM